MALIRTPVVLSHLDADHATFTGSADQLRTFQTPWGEIESAGKFPMIVLQRDLWEELGRPVNLIMSLDLVSADV